MANYTIKPIKLGTITRPVSNMLYGSENKDPFEFPLIAYYLESSEHKILVDTGGSVPHPDKWQPFVRKPNEELDVALQNIGVDPKDIDIVLFTHLHWDHASNNHFFPNARFIAQKIEVGVVTDEDVDMKGYEKALACETTYETVDGDVEIVPGISVALAPGHSKGLQVIIVDTEDGKYMITGDLVPRFNNWTSDPKIPNGSLEDLDAMLESYRKLETFGINKILPGHEPLVFEHKQYPEAVIER
jgi:glyoxylase-like metal-dependent hydrolase (beta-lactamase superfamily II)